MSGACGTVVATAGTAVATAGTVVAIVSWPGLARPPTTLPLQHRQSWMAGTSMPLGGPKARPEGPAMTRSRWGHQPVILTHMAPAPAAGLQNVCAMRPRRTGFSLRASRHTVSLRHYLGGRRCRSHLPTATALVFCFHEHLHPLACTE